MSSLLENTSSANTEFLNDAKAEKDSSEKDKHRVEQEKKIQIFTIIIPL